MKKAFTLVELLIVIVIVAILLSLLLSLGWNYVFHMQFRNDKEKFTSLYNKILSQSLSSSYYGDIKYDNLFLKMKNSEDKIDIWANQKWGGKKINLWTKTFPVSYFSGFVYEGDSFIEFEKWDFVFRPYELGCYFSWSGNFYSTWFISFELISSLDKSKYNFYVDLSSCKLFEGK